MVAALKQLWGMGLNPVLVARKEPRLVAVTKHRGEMDTWGQSVSMGIRCGQQPMGLSLMVLAFADAAIFAQWQLLATAAIYPSLLVASNTHTYHVYLFTGPEYVGCTLAGRYEARNGHARLVPSITLLGRGQRVAVVGSGDVPYHFPIGKGYDDIPLVTIAEYEMLLALCRRFDRRTPTASCAFAVGGRSVYVMG
ncbi:MAG: hypothetical protein R3E31_03260 [Chloroflexota bacterium]